MNKLVRYALTSLIFASPIVALAQDGYVTADVSLRAGPDIGYPRITMIPAGTGISVQGCIGNYAWCDVIAYGDRGWIAGDYIDYEYQDRRVLLPDYGARIGIPIISFVIGDYWGHHYRNRGFYRDRDRWYHRRFSHRPPPRPVYRRGYGNRDNGHRGYEGRGHGHRGNEHRGENHHGVTHGGPTHHSVQRREPSHNAAQRGTVNHRSTSGAHRGRAAQSRSAPHHDQHKNRHDRGLPHGDKNKNKDKHKSDDHHH